MITEFEIRNFRCFKHVKQTGLQRFNLLVGESGSGKTALLEAIFLAGGSNPEIYFRLRRWRGFGETVTMSATRDGYESFFRDLFYNFDQESGARIQFTASSSGRRILDIFYQDDDVLHLPLKTNSTGSEDLFSVVPIVFKWEGQKRITESRVTLTDTGMLRMNGSRDVYLMTFVSSLTLEPRANAVRFSDLSKRGKSSLALSAMQAVYPQIQELTVEFIAGEPMLHAALEGIEEKYPIANLSGGMNKYLSIVLSILSVPHGVVVIDEIENGFYYKDLRKIINGILSLSSTNGSQIFATTHSYELLQAVASAIDSNISLSSDVALMRLNKNNPCAPATIHLVQGKNYLSAIDSNFEMR